MTDKNYSLATSNINDNLQLYGLVTLRVIIGWHFLYEGIAKLLNPYWSSAAFLLDAGDSFPG